MTLTAKKASIFGKIIKINFLVPRAFVLFRTPRGLGDNKEGALSYTQATLCKSADFIQDELKFLPPPHPSWF